MNFICKGCAGGEHNECFVRNGGKPSPDCDCQHVVRQKPKS